jgi:hypothetical protein
MVAMGPPLAERLTDPRETRNAARSGNDERSRRKLDPVGADTRWLPRGFPVGRYGEAVMATSEPTTPRNAWAAAIVVIATLFAMAREQTPIDAPIDVTADELVATYRADATPRYHGEVLTVTGVVTRVGTSGPFVVLGNVQCAFDDARAVDELTVGDAVHLRGLGGGYILGVPMLVHCTIE